LEDLAGFGYVSFVEVFLGCACLLLADEKTEIFPFSRLVNPREIEVSSGARLARGKLDNILIMKT
jgi:hypothetical protein